MESTRDNYKPEIKGQTDQAELDEALKTAEEAVKSAEQSLLAATGEQDIETILKLSTEVRNAREELLKARQAANVSKVKDIERKLDAEIRSLVDAMKYEDLMGEPVKTIDWDITADGVSSVAINAKPQAMQSPIDPRARGFMELAMRYISRHPHGLTAREVVDAYLAQGNNPGIAEDPDHSLISTLNKHYADFDLYRDYSEPYRFYPHRPG